MQLGFVIDHSRCIGCHACTVACKAENDVPLGEFRTWVKYVDSGRFPEVKRSFAVLRCNQCTAAPCVEICPVRALHKRPDGIVDIDPAACIGCKACMQGCPYDALYLNDAKGIAEKCHFCAHRTELGLAPACAVVCPTEAIVPGDFHDAASTVARMQRESTLAARKEEAGTGPNVLYREVGPAGIDPSLTRSDGGYLWAERLPGVEIDGEKFQATLDGADAKARTSYDVDHKTHWGGKVTAYLFTKSLAAGAFLALPMAATPGEPSTAAWALPGLGLLFLIITAALLVSDLKRPARFLYILSRPNWSSWLTRGAVVLGVYGALLAAWLAWAPLRTLPMVGAGCLFAALTAGYTGWLFGQARGRVLWMRRGLWLHFIVQALVAGAALALLLKSPLNVSPAGVAALRWGLLLALLAHGALVWIQPRMAPARRGAEYARAMRLVTRGPFARLHGAGVLVAGVVAPVALLVLLGSVAAGFAAATLALVGLWIEEDVLVRAGQALPIS